MVQLKASTCKHQYEVRRFQFLMVQLKVCKNVYINPFHVISIPNGSIKRSQNPCRFQNLYLISIPNGSIKSNC